MALTSQLLTSICCKCGLYTKTTKCLKSDTQLVIKVKYNYGVSIHKYE